MGAGHHLHNEPLTGAGQGVAAQGFSVTAAARRGSRFLERFAEAWRHLLDRPRIAWEGAYLGTFVLALAFLIPVITAMGGNVGLQTSTIIVRSMRTERGLAGETGARLLHEWRVAFTNALILGTAVHLIVGFWLRDWGLATLVGGSLATVILVAATLGTVMPFALRRAGIDPAVAQGPFVTTLNDVIGILVYLGLASVFIDKLT